MNDQIDGYPRRRQPYAMTALYIGYNTSQWKGTAPQDYNDWIPRISPEVKHMNFNLDIFYQDKRITESNRSISWITFCDQEGKELRYLTQIEFWVQESLLVEMGFTYKKGSRIESKKLELLWDKKDSCANQVDIPKSLSQVFTIDGPGGERVSSVKAVFYGREEGPRHYKVSA